MTKKELIIPVLLIFGSILFAAICVMVFATKGESKKWIARKMKVGALLLTLNAAMPGSAQEIEVSCYDIAESDLLILKGNKTELVFEQGEKLMVEAFIDYRISTEYTYWINDEKNKVLKQGQINALDGSFDKWKEEIKVEIENSFAAGTYFFSFFNVPIAEQKEELTIKKLKIVIKP